MNKCFFLCTEKGLTQALTDSIFETGAYEVPSKSQNPTILGQVGLEPNVHTLAGYVVGTICLAPTTTLRLL